MSESFLLWGFGLIAAALLLFFIEVFVPSGGVIGVTALIAAVAGIIAFWKVSWVWGVISTLVVLVLIPICFNFAIRIMPHTPFGRRLILGDDDETTREASRRAEESQREQEQALVGAEGRALTDLRPVGLAEIEGTRIDVLAEAGVIPAGSRVKVIDVQGNQIKVRHLA